MRAARDWSCSASQAATTALVVRRRRVRRLRQHWRHEQLTLQMLLATSLHHSALRGQMKARAGEEESELNYTVKSPKTPPLPPQPELFSLYEEEPGGRRPASLRRVIEDPKITLHDVIPQRAVLPVPQMAEQLVEVPVPVPSFSNWIHWEETYRRTGHTWLGGFEWCLTATQGGL